VQVSEHLLVQEVRLVEEEDGVDALLREVLDVRGDGVEDGSGRRVRREAEREAELAVEVAPAQRRVVAAGERRAAADRSRMVVPSPTALARRAPPPATRSSTASLGL
jgi:hypothetical protein